MTNTCCNYSAIKANDNIKNTPEDEAYEEIVETGTEAFETITRLYLRIEIKTTFEGFDKYFTL